MVQPFTGGFPTGRGPVHGARPLHLIGDGEPGVCPAPGTHPPLIVALCSGCEVSRGWSG